MVQTIQQFNEHKSARWLAGQKKINNVGDESNCEFYLVSQNFGLINEMFTDWNKEGPVTHPVFEGRVKQYGINAH